MLDGLNIKTDLPETSQTRDTLNKIPCEPVKRNLKFYLNRMFTVFFTTARRIFPRYFCRMHFYNTLQSTPSFFGCHHQNPVCIFLLAFVKSERKKGQLAWLKNGIDLRGNILMYCLLSIPTDAQHIYRLSWGECARLRENVPYVNVHRYNPKHLCPKLNGYGDNGERSLKV